MRLLTHQEGRAWRWGILVASLLLEGFILSGCGRALLGANARSTPEQVPVSQSSSSKPILNVSPASGSGGMYVGVSGTHWPPNMLVLITLEDKQGRSSTLASNDTDQTGELTTGFLYPIDERWLADGSRWVVATTADGRVESKAEFAVLPPGDEPATVSSTTATNTATTTGAGVISHELSLPVLLVGKSADSPSAQQVEIDIAPGQEAGSIDCENERAMFTVAILTTMDFDATSVDPSTVTVAGGQPLSARYGQESPVSSHVEPAKRGPKQPKRDPNPRTRRAPVAEDTGYEWLWYLEDVDHDGHTDMVMQFRLSYINLPCDAAVVTLTGRTKDGRTFEGQNEVSIRALDEG